MTSTIDNRILDRLEELEMKVAFQDDTLTALNEVIAKQDREIQDLWRANKLLKQSMGDLRTNTVSPEQDAPPPHY